MEDQECPECGEKSLKAFVQHGSFFTRCISCEYEGPATSWLAVSASLKQPVRAILVTESYQELSLVANGTGNEVFEAVSQSAGQGKLVLLASPVENA